MPPSIPVRAPRLVALQAEPAQPLNQSGVTDTRGAQQLGVDAGGRKPRHRVELVDQPLLTVHEEVDPSKTFTADMHEGVDGQLADTLARSWGDAGGDEELHAPLGVLGLVVVPLAAAWEQDLPWLAGERGSCVGDALGIGASEYAALDLQAVGHRLDDRKLVVREGLIERAADSR